MSRYPKQQQSDNKDEQKPRGHKCSAYGCPLAGTNADGLKGAEQWYCRFHFGHDVSEFDAISTRINRNHALIEHARLVQRLGPVVMATQPEKFQTGNALHRRQVGEQWAPYLSRLNALIFDAIHNGPHSTKTEAA
jgi:hypothetical protein